MNDEIQNIIAYPPPFNREDKIFHYMDNEGKVVSFSYNDLISSHKNMGGINEKLLENSVGDKM